MAKKLIAVNIIFTPSVTASMINRKVVPADFSGVTFDKGHIECEVDDTHVSVEVPDHTDLDKTCVYVYRVCDVARVKYTFTED